MAEDKGRWQERRAKCFSRHSHSRSGASHHQRFNRGTPTPRAAQETVASGRKGRSTNSLLDRRLQALAIGDRAKHRDRARLANGRGSCRTYSALEHPKALTRTPEHLATCRIAVLCLAVRRGAFWPSRDSRKYPHMRIIHIMLNSESGHMLIHNRVAPRLIRRSPLSGVVGCFQ